MKTKYFVVAALTGLVAFNLSAQTNFSVPVLRVQADQVVGKIGPMFSGMMTEEINHSYDGGLYGELIQNRAFKDNPQSPVHWTAIQDNGATATIALDKANPLNEHMGTSLRLSVSAGDKSKRAGAANDGYWGIPVRPRTDYRLSFYARADGFSGPIIASIESNDGKMIFAQATVSHVGGDWQKYSVTLTAGKVQPTAQARLALTMNSPGTVWFSLVSLFPPTWKNRENGNRLDLMQKLSDMKPGFLRFPGGNYLEGSSIADRFPWKETLGDISQRTGHPSCWGYRSTDGMGLLEFLEWAEDLDAEPVLAVYAGYSLPPKNELIRSGPKLQPYVDDALNEIEYVIGGTNTTWGARRAAEGHPMPFPLRYIEIGNEDWFDNTGSYDGRFAQFFDAIKARYPQLQCISTVGNEQPEAKRVHSRKPDLLDEHYYRSAATFEKDSPTRFEKYDRNGPKIFVGEWAAYEDIVPWDKKSAALPPTPSLKAALADAAWMAAMERNADIIPMQCYAPMLVNVNPGGRQWRPNLIGYDALNSFGSPSYYANAMFNSNRGDVAVRSSLDGFAGDSTPALDYSVTKDTASGALYINVINVTSNSQALQIHLDGVKEVASRGSMVVMKSAKQEDSNSINDPVKVVPHTEKVRGLAVDFTRMFEPYSVNILKLETK